MFELEQSSLKNALKLVARSVAPRNNIPILQCAKFHHDNDRYWITGFDLDTEVSVAIEVKGNVGEFCVNFRDFHELVKSSDGDIKIETQERDIAIVFSDGSAASLPVLPLDDFPEFTSGKDAKPVNINPVKFGSALRRVRKSISTEETRYYLNGTCLSLGQTDWHVVSTNGHALSAVSMGDKPIGMDKAMSGSIILPTNAVDHLINLLPETETNSETSFQVNEKSFSVFGDGWRVKTKLIDGTYPDWKHLIPTDQKPIWKVDRAGISRFLRRANAIKATIVEMEPFGACVELKSANDDQCKVMSRVWATCPQSEKFLINPKYLKHIIDTVKTPVINFQVSGEKPPMIIVDGDLTILQMGMRNDWYDLSKDRLNAFVIEADKLTEPKED